MKRIKIYYRLPGAHIDGNGLSVWNSDQKESTVASLEEFLEKFPPAKSSEKLSLAIEKAYNENGTVSYHVQGIMGNSMICFRDEA